MRTGQKSNLDDYQAVAAIARGDLNGLDVLVRRYQTKATRVAYLITNDLALAEDSMQSAFVQLVEHIDQFDPARRFEPWFMRIVVNLALKTVGQGKRVLELDVELPDPHPNPEAAVEDAELEQWVRAALLRLAPEQRAVIVLRYYLGYTETEISEELGSPIGTIRWRMHAARTMLKQLLAKPGIANRWSKGGDA